MATRRRTFLISAGAAVLFLAVASGSPAQERSHSGDFAFMITASEEMPLGDGHVLTRVVQSGMVFADDPASPRRPLRVPALLPWLLPWSGSCPRTGPLHAPDLVVRGTAG